MSWLKSLRGSGELAELPEELTQLLAQVERDSQALRELLKKSETAEEQFKSLVDPLEAMQATSESLNAQMSDLQARVEAFEGSASTIDTVASQATRLTESQAAHVSTLEAAARTIRELTTKVDDLRTVFDGAVTAKDEGEKLIADLVGPTGSFTKIRADMDTLMADAGRFEGRAEALGQVEKRLVGASEQAGELEEGQKLMARFLESVSGQLVETEKKVSELGDGLQSAGLVKQELEGFVGPDGALAKVRAQVEEAREQSLSYGQEVARCARIRPTCGQHKRGFFRGTRKCGPSSKRSPRVWTKRTPTWHGSTRRRWTSPRPRSSEPERSGS